MKAKTKTASRTPEAMPAAAMPKSQARTEPARGDLRAGFFLAAVVRLVWVTWMCCRECVGPKEKHGRHARPCRLNVTILIEKAAGRRSRRALNRSGSRVFCMEMQGAGRQESLRFLKQAVFPSAFVV